MDHVTADEIKKIRSTLKLTVSCCEHHGHGSIDCLSGPPKDLLIERLLRTIEAQRDAIAGVIKKLGLETFTGG